MRRPTLEKSFAVIGFLFLLAFVSGTAVAGGVIFSRQMT